MISLTSADIRLILAGSYEAGGGRYMLYYMGVAQIRKYLMGVAKADRSHGIIFTVRIDA